ncbi:MAG: hypothetical protein ACYSOQ_03785, partial [Planctomycetota bacterium]
PPRQSPQRTPSKNRTLNYSKGRFQTGSKWHCLGLLWRIFGAVWCHIGQLWRSLGILSHQNFTIKKHFQYQKR